MGKSYQSHTFKNVQSNFYDKTSEKSTALKQSENFVLYYDSPLSHVWDFGLGMFHTSKSKENNRFAKEGNMYNA